MGNLNRSQTKAADLRAKEKKKLIFVGLLVIAFVAVLYLQFCTSDESTAMAFAVDAAVGKPKPIANASPVASTAAEPTWSPALPVEYEIVTLKSRTLDQIIARHPLAKPFTEVTSIEAPEVVEPIEVRAIYASSTHSAALIGVTIVRDGEALPDGRRLVTASPDGIKALADGR